MSNNDNDFSDLWQKQDVSQIDIGELKRQWKLIRIKQFSYMVLDFSGLLIAFLALYFVPKKLEGFEMVAISLVIGITTVWVAYCVWLRRFSLGFVGAKDSTLDCVELIKTQYKQNIKIARLNKYASYVLPVMFAVFFSVAYLGEFLELEAIYRKLKIIAPLFVIIMPLNWIWARKRQAKFENALIEFETKCSELNHK